MTKSTKKRIAKVQKKTNQSSQKLIVSHDRGVSKRQRTETNPTISLLLELIPGIIIFVLGIGHFYNGNIAKGLGFLIGYWILLILELMMFVVVGIGTLGIGLFVYIPLVTVINLVVIIASSMIAHKDAQRRG